MLAKLINRLLSATNFIIIRRNTLDKLIHENAVLNEVKSGKSPNILNNWLVQNSDQLRKEFIQNQIALKWEIIDALERTISPSETRICELCSHQDEADNFKKIDTHCAFGGGILHRYQCPKCDVIFGADKIFQLSDLELTNEYERHYSVYEEGDSTEQELRAFHSLKPNRNGTFLNYGGGNWSSSVEKLRNAGWNVFVFEPHSSASSGHEYVITSKAQLSLMQFDGIFSNNVLEHLRDPIAELKYISTLLKPDAKMSHATPCFEYLYDYTRFHLFFYLGRSRNYIIENAGLTEINFISEGEFICSVMELKKK